MLNCKMYEHIHSEIDAHSVSTKTDRSCENMKENDKAFIDQVADFYFTTVDEAHPQGNMSAVTANSVSPVRRSIKS